MMPTYLCERCGHWVCETCEIVRYNEAEEGNSTGNGKEGIDKDKDKDKNKNKGKNNNHKKNAKGKVGPPDRQLEHRKTV